MTVTERSVWKAVGIRNEALWCVRDWGSLWGSAIWDVYGSQGLWCLWWLQTGLSLSVCRGAGRLARKVYCSSSRDDDGLERAEAVKWKIRIGIYQEMSQ